MDEIVVVVVGGDGSSRHLATFDHTGATCDIIILPLGLLLLLTFS